MQSLIGPLNHCLLISERLDSQTQTIVQNALQEFREIDEMVKQMAASSDISEFSGQMKHHREELDFYCQALSLGISLNRRLEPAAGPKPHSMSALLRASHCMRSMQGLSGELFSSKGTLLASIKKEEDPAWAEIYPQAVFAIEVS